MIHDYDCDLWVTIVGCVDELDSDLGDFSCQRFSAHVEVYL